MFLALFASMALSVSPQDVTVNGLLNGDFERLLHHGAAGPPSAPVAVDGAYWVGAELHTRLDGTDRYLELRQRAAPPSAGVDFAYQRIGTAVDRGGSAVIEGRIRVPGPDTAQHEGRVSFSEGTGRHWLMEWLFEGFHQEGDVSASGDPLRWAAAYSPDGTTRLPLTFHKTAVGVPAHFADAGFAIDATGTTVPEGASGSGSYVEVVWIAPEAGWVRVLNRPWRRDAVAETVRYEMWRESAGTLYWLAQADVEAADESGPLVLARARVAAGDEIRVRAVRTAPVAGQTVVLASLPVLAYEGRALTYRFGHDLGRIADTADERFITVPLAASELDTWKSFTLDAGADFESASGFGAAPLPPLDVKLSTPVVAPLSTVVGFDDVRGYVDFERYSESDLRTAILAEAQWAMDSVRGTNACANGDGGGGALDRNDSGCRRGPRSSPYQAHAVELHSGRVLADWDLEESDCTQRIQVDAPRGAWELLRRNFDEELFDDYVLIHERRMFKGNLSPQGFMYTKYDVELDRYMRSELFNPCGSYPEGVPDPKDYQEGIETTPYLQLLEIYEQRPDPHLLDRAFKVAVQFARNGVFESADGVPSEGVGLIAYKAYDIDTGALVMPKLAAFLQMFGQAPFYKPTRHLRPTGALLRIYAEAQAFNIEVAPRFQPVPLDDLESALDAAITAAIPIRHTGNPGGEWGERWPVGNAGIFNDWWGYQSLAALEGYRALRRLAEVRLAHAVTTSHGHAVMADGLTAREGAMLSNLLVHWLESGTGKMLESWEQQSARGAFLPGDHVRGWEAFVEAIEDSDVHAGNAPLRARFERAIIETALYSTKFQYVHRAAGTGAVLDSGIWTSGGLDRGQLLDISSKQLGGASNYALALSFALRMPSLTAAEREHVLAALGAYLRANQRHFKADDPTVLGPGDGYGYWPHAARNPHPSGADWPGGFEWRPLESFLRAIDNLGPSAFGFLEAAVTPAPRLSISPSSYTQTQPEVYTFKMEWDQPVSASERLAFLNERTSIVLYGANGGAWSGQTAYPDPNTDSFLGLDTVSLPDPLTLVVSTTAPILLPAQGAEIEVAIQTHDENGLWRAAVSVQER